MTPRKPLILLKKSGAFAFQLVSRPTTKSRHFGGEIDGSRGGKTSKFLHLEVAECRRETECLRLPFPQGGQGSVSKAPDPRGQGAHRTDRCRRGLRAHREARRSAVARCAPSRPVVRRPGGRVGSSQGSYSGGPDLTAVHGGGGPSSAERSRSMASQDGQLATRPDPKPILASAGLEGTSDLQMRDGALRQARQRPSATRFGDSFA